MKKENEEKLIKYLRSLIFRTLGVTIIFLVLAILSKGSKTYKDLIVTNIYEKNISFAKIRRKCLLPINKCTKAPLQVMNIIRILKGKNSLSIKISNFLKKNTAKRCVNAHTTRTLETNGGRRAYWQETHGNLISCRHTHPILFPAGPSTHVHPSQQP